MIRRIVTLLFVLLAAVALRILYAQYPISYLYKGYQTAVALFIIYLVFKVFFQEIVIKRVKESKIRYSIQKTISTLYLVIFLLFFATVWLPNLQTLLVAYGLIAAGVAISLQDLFKNFAGGIILFARGIYSVGDRIEISKNYGDVIDIGILYTTLLEIREWVDGDQATGRLVMIPNGYILSYDINNYTKDHSFIWDEIMIPISYDSDWQEAQKKIMHIAKEETKENSAKAEREISSLEEKYYLTKRPTEPEIFLKMTDNWIAFNIRYITEVRRRRQVHNELTQKILKEIQKSKNIKIASQTLDIIGFPGKKK